jgi:hypothetical protein
MDKKYLLTYQDGKHPYGTFAWFFTEDELWDFVEKNKVHVIQAIYIKDSEEIG